MRSKISAQVYHSHIKGQKENHQNQLVLNIMREINMPQTIRMIHRIINGRGYQIDLVSLRRAVTNLNKPTPSGQWCNSYKQPVLIIEFERECPITKKKVGWYNLAPNFKPAPKPVHALQQSLFAAWAPPLPQH